jgi:putative oxidoreductase
MLAARVDRVPVGEWQEAGLTHVSRLQAGSGDRDGKRAGRWGVTILRVMTASIFIVHGVARAALGIVDPFGAFLSDSGLPAGTALAWLITIVEIVGGIALGLGLAVRPLVSWFGLQILVGIFMVHAKAGWFVVGAGRNGAEYSVLVIVCLAAISLTESISYTVPFASRR